MKRNATLLTSLIFLYGSFANAQANLPYSFNNTLEGTIPTIEMPSHDFTEDIEKAIAFEQAGNYPRFARHFDVNVTMLNSGIWNDLDNGDKVWRLNLKSKGALSTALFFDNFYLPTGSTLNVYSSDHTQLFSYTSDDNQGNDLFSTEFIKGEEQIIEYFEPAKVKGQGRLRITSLSHQYRSIAMAGGCHVNIICSPEGNNWQDEKRGVVRIYTVNGSDAGYCTGTLINNTAKDCKRYILTAFHCALDATAANFTQWRFYFNYEASTCNQVNDQQGTQSNSFTGCVKKAASDNIGSLSGSDFLLIEMTNVSSPSWWANVYFNGWNINNTAPPSNSISIHHPLGHIKKISTTSSAGSNSSFYGTPNTHWRVFWKQTSNGWGVTEPGSSGSPIFKADGQIVGTLSGGGSDCNNTTLSDSYGKMSFHWTSNSTASDRQLKPWLDPLNLGVTSCNGSFSPCTSGIDDITKEASVNVYPNPNNGEFNIDMKLDKPTDIKIRVLNIIGQEILNQSISNTMNNTYSINLKNQTNGIYFVEIMVDKNPIIKKINIVK